MTLILTANPSSPEQPPSPKDTPSPNDPKAKTASKVDLFASMIFSIGGKLYVARIEGHCADRQLWTFLKRALEEAFPYHFDGELPKQMELTQIKDEVVISDTMTLKRLNSQYAPAIAHFLQRIEKEDPERPRKQLSLIGPQQPMPQPPNEDERPIKRVNTPSQRSLGESSSHQ